MKRFLKQFVIFLLPILGSIVLLFILPLDKSFAYHYIKQDCAGHGAWIHHRIFENPKPVDIAFIGSSRTIHGVMDELLEKELGDTAAIHVATLGYCRLGRNMSYLLLKDLLKRKHPKVLVLEVREDEDHFSHPMFPYVADAKDVLFPTLLFNRDVLIDPYLNLETRFEYQKQRLLGKIPVTYPQNDRQYGYGPSDLQAEAGLLEIKKQERRLRAEWKLKAKGRNFHMRFPRSYLHKINQLVKENDIELYFLYLPEYGWPLDMPFELHTYQQYGQVLLPPEEIFTNTRHWMDDGHLNDNGAQELSKWLSKHLPTPSPKY